MTMGGGTQLHESNPPMPPQEIQSRIRRDPRKPVRRFQFVLDLILPLERLDESLLGKILRIVDIPHNPVNLTEDALQILLDEPLLQLLVFQS